MSVLVEMKVAGWSWALLPKAPHSFWSYQQKSLLFQQWFPWQCNQSRKEGGKKSQWHFRCKLYQKKQCFLGRTHGAYPLQEWELLTAERRSFAEGGDTPRCQPFRDPEGRKNDGVWSKHWEATAARVTRVHGTGTGAAASPWCQPKVQRSHCTVPAQRAPRCRSPGVTDLRPRSHPQQGTAASSKHRAASHDSCLPCPQLFRKKLYLVIIRNTSRHTRPFLKEVSLQGNTQVQKHTAIASSLLQGLQTDWKRQKSKPYQNEGQKIYSYIAGRYRWVTRHKWKHEGVCPQIILSALQLTMHMARWEQLRSFLTWKTKWWRARKCFLQLHEHKWGTYKKSLLSSLQNPFRSQLSQHEH